MAHLRVSTFIVFFAFFLPAAVAQTPTPAAPPVAYSSVSELNGILGQIRQFSQNLQADLTKTRVDRWKTDSGTKRQTQSNMESIQRNLQAALPELMAQLQNSPEDVALSFKLYRNLDVLYDVFGSVAESAGAFGSKDEFQSLSNDLSALDTARRSLGERMQTVAAAKETELTSLRSQIKALQAAAPPPPPKKIIVDDNEPPKKPVKKKPVKPATPGTTPTKPGSPGTTPAAAKPAATPTGI
jgi:exonuclease VII large subunit